MKVFVTGAAGFIGTATIEELHKHGHTVLGLARSDANATVLQKLGAQVHRGNLEDLASLKAGAGASDGVIHLGFVHDFSRFEEVCAIDRAAISALAEGLGNGSGKPLVIASGTLGLQKVEVADENTQDAMEMGALSARAKSAILVKELSKQEKDGAWELGSSGRSAYVEGTEAAWPSVHRVDAAVLLRLVLEKGQAGGVYHAVAEEGVPIKDLASLIARKLGVPVQGLSMEEAQSALGFLAFPWALKNYTSSEKTKKELGWMPTQKGWLEDIEENYFTEEAIGSKRMFKD